MTLSMYILMLMARCWFLSGVITSRTLLATLCSTQRASQRKSSDRLSKALHIPSFPDIRPLYNIPNVLASDRVIWVEGEKCADALNDVGYTATCTIGGAGALTKKTAHQFDFSPLQNKELILWPDNDPAGKKLADLIRTLLCCWC